MISKIVKLNFNEKFLRSALFFITLLMIILRFLLNEKGRVTPDSLRFMRTAHVFPVIDNTTTPFGYPLSIKFFTLFGLDEFWSSKVVGILSFLVLVWLAKKKDFFYREILLTCGLFSFISLFSATLSEGLFLVFVFIFFYVSHQIITKKLFGSKAVFFLSLSLILLFNIRYTALFFMGGSFLYGIFYRKNTRGKIFIYSSLLGVFFILFYKFFFVDVFNEHYVSRFLEMNLHPTSLLIKEFFLGMFTAFNPFIHIANPGGGKINFIIYGVGLLNIAFIIFLFLKNQLDETEKLMIFMGIIGILCSYFIQYFYSVDSLDYRLLSPYSFPIWLVYFKKLFSVFGKIIYMITFLSIIAGFIFSWLSRGNYLENRKALKTYLVEEGLTGQRIYYYSPSESDMPKMKIAEMLSTVNSDLKITFNPKDTLSKNCITEYKILQKVKLQKNKFQ